jgi:heme a synthase
MQLIRRWALATFVLTFLVIIAGGVVRTTQSGMGCPDWPKCFGRWIPPTNASQLPPDFEKYLKKQDIDHTFNAWHTWIEYINRLLGALLGLFALIQVGLLFFKRQQNRRSFRLALAFLAVVILTGLFGAIVVKLNLAHLSISVHLFFALLLVQLQAALLLSLKEKLFVLPASLQIRRLLLVLLLVLVAQGVLGTMVRMYVDDVSKALQYGQREKWLADFPVSFIIHRSFSWFVLVLTSFVVWKGMAVAALKNSFYLLAALVVLNMLAGIILFYADMPAFAQPIHLLLATAAITQTVALWLQTKNNTGASKTLAG